MSGLTATLSTTWLFEHANLPTTCAVPRPTSSPRHARTATMTIDFVLTLRLRRRIMLPRRGLGTVTVSFARKPGETSGLWTGDSTEIGASSPRTRRRSGAGRQVAGERLAQPPFRVDRRRCQVQAHERGARDRYLAQNPNVGTGDLGGNQAGRPLDQERIA